MKKYFFNCQSSNYYSKTIYYNINKKYEYFSKRLKLIVLYQKQTTLKSLELSSNSYGPIPSINEKRSIINI